jgi:hypothetical protein
MNIKIPSIEKRDALYSNMIITCENHVELD